VEEKKNNRKEIAEYYDQFYQKSDFSYYSEKITKRFLKTMIKECKLNPGDRILDIGCGTGYYINFFSGMGFDAIGIDISKTAIDKAKEKYPGSNFKVADAFHLPFEKKSINLVFLYGCSVVNCIDPGDINNYLNYVCDFIKDGGYIIYIGGSNLSGRVDRNSEWFHHNWNDIKMLSC
jgi:ubiquinone/menaquinone biosynthesis C-methylase UbiE